MGGGPLRADATRARDLAPTAFRRRDYSGVSRRQKAVGSSSRSIEIGRLFVSEHAWCSGEKGGRGKAAGSETRGRVR